MPDLIPLAQQYRAALERQDAAALNRLIQAYGNIYKRLQSTIDALAMEIVDGEMTRGQVVRLERYRSLIAQIGAELRKFQGFAGTTMDDAARAAIQSAAKDSVGLMGAAANDAGIVARFNRLPKNVVEQLLGFLQPDSPLFKRLEMLAPTTAQMVADTILGNIAIGKNPRAISRLITDALGQGLTSALRMARTVQLYSYREASRANYIANSDVVAGWVWFAQLDSSTCMSCIAQHGTLHPLTETLNDHHNGRCAPLPQVVDADNPVEQAGADWFGKLSADEQRAMLGRGRYDAFKAGRFDIPDLSGERDDDVYGPMRVEVPLKELVG